jgi:hypothetical protein
MGDEQCEWKAWFKAHNEQFDRVPDDFNQTLWQIEHTSLLKATSDRLLADGYRLLLENQNKFKLHGKGGFKVAGKPDIVAVRGQEGLVCDTKTGQVRSSDNAQVMIYMWALHASRRFPAVEFRGRVVYRDSVVDIPPSAVGESFQSSLFSLVRRLSTEAPPLKVPSAPECRFCQIAKTECPDRVEDGEGDDAAD